MTTKLTHYHLSAEEVNDEHGKAIMLTQQDDYDEPATVLVHPWQLHAVCEQFGIITSDPQAAKTIAALQRRMVGLHERIEALADWMANYSDHKHADLTYETTQINALADLAREWCHDFEESEQAAPCAQLAAETSEKPPECKPAPAPAAQGSLL